MNQHKSENPECSKGKLSLSTHFLFSYTEFFACHHKNRITALMASFRKAFLFWAKAHKPQIISQKKRPSGEGWCAQGHKGDLMPLSVEGNWTGKLHLAWCLERETRNKREFNPQLVEWHCLSSTRKLFLAPQNSQNMKWIQPEYILESHLQISRWFCFFGSSSSSFSCSILRFNV